MSILKLCAVTLHSEREEEACKNQMHFQWKVYVLELAVTPLAPLAFISHIVDLLVCAYQWICIFSLYPHGGELKPRLTKFSIHILMYFKKQIGYCLFSFIQGS